ncbi:hypothetical protein NE639_26455, partial [Blautia producta]|nr:hypothetical protein [Blautia producta]
MHCFSSNCIVHAYEKETEKIRIDCTICGRELTVAVTDHGRGIENVEKAMEPMPERSCSGFVVNMGSMA